MIVATFNGLNIIALPCDTLPGVTKPSSIEWDEQEVVSASVSPFTGQTQTYDWMASWWEAQVSFPPMTRYAADAWSAFILECRGQLNAFMLGDPKARLPKGPAMGSPVVAGAGQAGYSLATRGWAYANPLANPSFLLGNTGWAPQAGWSIIPAIGPDGLTWAGSYVGPGTSAIVNANHISCSAGQVLTATCKSLGQPGATGNAVLRINFFDASGVLLVTGNSATPVMASGNWWPVSVSGIAPTGAAYFTVDFSVYASTNTIAWYCAEFNCTNLAGGPPSILLPGDFIQIGYRLYKVLSAANCDGDGNATLSIWPPLRDLPADGTAIQTRNCKGLFRLKQNTGNKWSTNVGNYGLSGFGIREAI